MSEYENAERYRLKKEAEEQAKLDRIRADALEEAARLVEERFDICIRWSAGMMWPPDAPKSHGEAGALEKNIAAAIRALKDKKP